jgi:polyisoprenoid-binding protein YceI
MRRTVSLWVGLSLLALAAGCEKAPGTGGGGSTGLAGGAGPAAPSIGGEAKTTPAAEVGPAAGAAATLSTDPKAIKLTPANTHIDWVGTKNDGKHNGSFKQFAGTLDLKGDDPTAARVAVEIDATSLDSDTPMLTGHLKSRDFFEVSTYPKATFVSTAIKAGGSGGANHSVTGDLTLHGVTKSLTFPATIAVTADAATLTSEFTINRQDFGINYQPDRVHTAVTIKLDVRAPRK